MSRAHDAPKICFATPSYPPVVGGISRSSGRVVGYLVEHFDVHVFTFTVDEEPDGTPLRTTEEGGAHVHRIGLPPGASEMDKGYRMAQAVRRFDDATPFALFHCFFLPLAYPCLVVAARGARPVMASLRGADGHVWLKDQWNREIIGHVLRRVSWVTSVNTEILDNVAPLGLDRSRSSIIFNAVAGRSSGRWSFEAARRGLVGTVGDFRAIKDIPLLVDAYADLGPALRGGLLLVGDFSEEDERARTFALAESRGVADETELTGIVGDEEIARRLLTMNVFVVCSNKDGLPNALLEAATLGVPLVGTRVGGMRDILFDQENALVVESGDRRGLASALESVLRDEHLARRLSAGASELARSLDPSREKAKWLDLYERLMRGD